jgi:hypothetical protein
MEDPKSRHADEPGGESTASRVEEWLRGLRSGRATSTETTSRSGRAASPADDPAEAFLKAARRLAASPRAQEALARRFAQAEGSTEDPALRALARVLETLGKELSGALGAQGGPPSGGAAVLDRPTISEERRLSDDEGGGGDDDLDDDDGGGGGDDEEPWPSAFVGYRVGLLSSVDVGTCQDGCCTAVFMDHPGLRAAVWFPTEAAAAMATNLSEFLERQRGETAQLGVPPFGAGDPPPRGQVQASIQFFTEDVHLDPVEEEPDRREGGFCRFMAYDQGLGHGGPPLVDALLDAAQARALRRGLRRAARNAAKGRE